MVANPSSEPAAVFRRIDSRGGFTPAALLAGALMMLLSASAAAGDQSLTDVERALPEFELPGTDGQTWSAEDLRGKPWIVNFWATWCPPCIEEMPSMNRAWQSIQDEGVGMLAINAGEGELAVAQFLDKIAIDFPVVLGDGSDTLPNWSVRALPTTIVVDPAGQVVFEALGPREWDDPALLERVLELR